MWFEKQRVISRNEPDLGVGTILKVNTKHQLQVYFSRIDDTRIYNLRPAPPLQRYVLKVGDVANVHDGRTFSISHVEHKNGIYRYSGESDSCYEYELSDQAQDLGTVDRFLDGQFTDHRTYGLRQEAWRIRGRSRGSKISGMVGPRVMPLAHQLYIARSVVDQHHPRILLADEVGLGKTIESGLIFGALRALERAGRVLWLVPESLKHQWLAEMYRRFNELITVFDKERCDQEEESQQDSPFLLFQKICASITFFEENPERLEQALEVDWDLIIVDEAHHLKYQDEYWKIVKKLSLKTHGLLLLTATPQMYGVENHFGLLNLADPDRFDSFEKFVREAEQMNQVAQLARRISQKDLSALPELHDLFPGDQELVKLTESTDPEIEKILSALVDRHGTGRLFFRNRRARLKGFPQRKLNSICIEKSDRLNWVKKMIESSDDKVLLICSSAKQVVKMANHFIEDQVAVFHESLNVVDRDAQAAKFASEDDVKLMICSEIGGEGRNFQFCHKLILYDLPMTPDLVEQRIGRLDRIGQKGDIEIMVPWESGTAEEVIFRWYHEGLNAFESSWNGTSVIFEKFQQELEQIAESFDGTNSAQLDELILKTKAEVRVVKERNEQSVDILIDINSLDEAKGAELVDAVEDRDDDPTLEFFIKGLFDLYGVEYHEFDDRGSIVVSGESLSFIEDFPGISSDKDTVLTFDRKVALEREDIVFLSQDHSIAEESLSMLLDRNEGVASMCRWPESPHGNGALIEASVLLESSGPKHLELSRYLPLAVKNHIFDHRGREIFESVHIENQDLLRELPKDGSLDGDPRLVAMLTPIIEKIMQNANLWAQHHIDLAIKDATQILSAEEDRLVYLSQVNRKFNQNELQALKEKKKLILHYIETVQPRLDAIRIIFTEAE